MQAAGLRIFKKAGSRGQGWDADRRDHREYMIPLMVGGYANRQAGIEGLKLALD
jgi:hypothetical protein